MTLQKEDKAIDDLTTVNEIEKNGFDFLRELPDNVEEEIESNKFQEWARENF